jgi:hypothetical protein
MGASAELREVSAGREKVVALPACAAWCALMAGEGRTGAVGCPHRVAPRSAGPVLSFSLYRQSRGEQSRDAG